MRRASSLALLLVTLLACKNREAEPGNSSARIPDAPGATGGLTRQQAQAAALAAESQIRKELTSARSVDLSSKRIVLPGGTLRFELSEHGLAPAAGHALIISMRGGGSTSASENDQQWRNQIRLYEPSEAFYVAPRAPTDSWDMWHQAAVDLLFDRLIEDFIVLKGVDPNRVYLTGYSERRAGRSRPSGRRANQRGQAALQCSRPPLHAGNRDLPA